MKWSVKRGALPFLVAGCTGKLFVLNFFNFCQTRIFAQMQNLKAFRPGTITCYVGPEGRVGWRRQGKTICDEDISFFHFYAKNKMWQRRGFVHLISACHWHVQCWKFQPQLETDDEPPFLACSVYPHHIWVRSYLLCIIRRVYARYALFRMLHVVRTLGSGRPRTLLIRGPLLRHCLLMLAPLNFGSAVVNFLTSSHQDLRCSLVF